MATDDDEIDETPEILMGCSIQRWLRESGPDWQLVEWLQGYGLPPVRGDDEPYYWIMQGLESIGQLDQSASAFCSRIAHFLEQQPDKARPGRRPNQVLYNLFMLCAYLRCPDRLAEPLKQIFKRRVVGGRWQAFDLRDALLAALIKNQDDDDLLPVWEQMIRKGRHDYLPGDRFDGWDGVLSMVLAHVVKTGELNNVGPISTALTLMVKGLDGEQNKVYLFDEILENLAEVLKSHVKIWSSHLIRQLNYEVWPNWAVGVLSHHVREYQIRSGEKDYSLLTGTLQGRVLV